MRFRALSALTSSVLMLAAVTMLNGCGGGSTPAATSVTASPSSISISPGDVYPLSVSAANSSGTTVSADFNFASSNPSLITINSAGQVCAGQWDVRGVDCTAATATGQANIVVTPQKGSGSATVSVYVHERVDYIEATAPSDCTSSTIVTTVSAKAVSNNSAVCARLNTAAPCTVPASTLGPFSWSALDSTVVSFSNTTNNFGIATAAAPGETSIYASLGSLKSTGVPFRTCPIVSLTAAATDVSGSTFSHDEGYNEQYLTAVAIDSKGVELENPPIEWISTNPYAYTLAETAGTSTVSATTLKETATAANSGSVSTLLPVCVAPTCNVNLSPLYGNSFVAKVNGTANTPTVYAASTKSTSIIPINSDKAGDAISLPHVPNSFLMNQAGTRGVLGADNGGIMTLTTSSNSISTLSFNGKVLAIAPNGDTAIASDAPDQVVIIFSISSGSVKTAITAPLGASSASFTPDSGTVWFVDGTNASLYTWNSTQGTIRYTLGGVPKSVAFIANGPLGYLAGGANNGAANTITARATCDPNPSVANSQVDVKTLTNLPTLLAQVPSGDGVVALEGGKLAMVSGVQVSQACPPVATETANEVDLSSSTLSVTQLLTSPDSTKAALLTSNGGIDIVDLTTLAAGGCDAQSCVKTATLSAGATTAYQGGIMADSTSLYVGASDGTVHKIDLTSASDAETISVSLKDSNSNTVNPNLVVVRNK